MKPPKFYDQLMEEKDEFEMEFIKEKRTTFALQNEDSIERLRVKNKLKLLKSKQLIRPEI